MFSTTIKRSVATLGVVAGLLVAAGPASAQVLPGMVGVKAPTKAGTQVGHEGHNAVLIQKHDHQSALVKAPSKATDPSGAGASFTLDVASSEAFELNTFGLTEHEGAAFRGEVTGLEPNALGTQVGSEGVKAPKPPASSEEPTESISFNYLKAAGTETGNPERKGSLNASGGWDPTLALNSEGIALHAVATAVVGGVVPGGAIVSA